MPQLPMPEITVQPQESYQSRGRNASASSFGADIGGLAQGLDQASSYMQQREQRQAAFDTQRDYAAAGSDWMTQMQDREQKAPLGAQDFTKSNLADFDTYTQKMVDDRRKQGWSEDALNGLQDRMSGLRQNVQDQSLKFEAQSRGAKVRSDTEGAIVNFSQIASTAPGTLTSVEDQWGQMADTLPLDAVQREQLKQNGLTTIRQSAGIGLAEKDPQAVIGALTNSDPTGGPRAGYYASIRAAESSGNDAAVNGKAVGRYQFMESTWAGIMKSHPELGLTADGRTNPHQQEIAIRVATQENADALSSAGIAPSNGNLYAAHFLGAGGATSVLRAPDGDQVSSHISAKAVSANSFLDGMTVGQFKAWADSKGNGTPAPHTTDGKTGNAVLDSLDASQRSAVLSRAYTFQNRQDAQLRADLGQRVDNASAALLQTGEYAGQMPTQGDFATAYSSDPTQGAIEWSRFQADQRVGQNIAAFKTLPADQINARLTAMEPQDTSSPSYATDLKGFDSAQKAAATIIQQRSADPAGYVQRTFPSVQDALQGLDGATDPGQRQQAMQTVLARENAAYDTLGIPAAQRALLPDAQAKSTLAGFNDTNQSFDQRIGAPLATVFATSDKQQQQQIFEQLVRSDNGFGKFQAAFEAYGRGDTGASRRLFQAGMVNPDTIAGKLPGDVKADDISSKIASKVMASGQIGDATYGFSANVVVNQERARRDSALMVDAVKNQIVAQGNNDVDRAIDQVTRDIYGRNVVVNADNVSAIVPEGTDQNAFAAGAQRLRGMLSETLGAMAPVGTGKLDPQERGAFAVQQQMFHLTAQDILERGEWRSMGDGYSFVDTASGLSIPGPDGKPLTFSLDQVISAGKGRAADTSGFLKNDIFGGQPMGGL